MSDRIENWFEYKVKVQPHHTDYGGIVWHGSYIAWMEEARVEYFRCCGLEYADLVALGYHLSVVELSLRYHRSIPMGTTAIVKTKISEIVKVRINFDYKIQSPDKEHLYSTARVTLVPVDGEKGKIVRQLPPALEEALIKGCP